MKYEPGDKVEARSSHEDGGPWRPGVVVYLSHGCGYRVSLIHGGYSDVFVDAAADIRPRQEAEPNAT